MLVLHWPVAAHEASANSGGRREVPTVGGSPAPHASRNRSHPRRGRAYAYPYYYSGYYPYNPPLALVPPYASYYIPPTVVATLPYFCLLHQAGWVSRAGFLDHIAGTHKLPLDSAASFCPDGADGCLFPGY